MRKERQRLLVVLIVLLGGGLGAGALWVLRGSGTVVGPSAAGGAASLEPTAGVELQATADGRASVNPAELSSGIPDPAPPGGGVVVIPLEVELDLVRPAALVEDGVEPPGTGATARLVGSVLGRGGEGIPAEVRFIAGANEGRRLACDATGAFGANDLYPGLSIVRVTAPGVLGAERELRLRQREETQLNIAFDRPSVVYGAVTDDAGTPLPGTEVAFDGQVAVADENGEFYFGRVAPGRIIVRAHKPGYARYREQRQITGNTTIPKGEITLVLAKGADLEITVETRLSTNEPVKLFLSPANWMGNGLRGQPAFPWYEVSPAEVYPGGTVRIEDLPAERVLIRPFHTGTVSKLSSAALRAGNVTKHEVTLEPAETLKGKVTLDGKPVARAEVVLEAPDRVVATMKTFGEPLQYLETGVYAQMPPAHQVAHTDESGAFAFTPWFELAGARYLRATSPDGEATAGRVVRSGDTDVELQLTRGGHADGELVLRPAGQRLALPVEVRVNGEPREPFSLQPEDRLTVAGLEEGEWKLTVRWDREVLLDAFQVELTPRATLDVKLPVGAIEGQDVETRARIGDLRPDEPRWKRPLQRPR